MEKKVRIIFNIILIVGIICGLYVFINQMDSWFTSLDRFKKDYEFLKDQGKDKYYIRIFIKNALYYSCTLISVLANLTALIFLNIKKISNIVFVPIESFSEWKKNHKEERIERLSKRLDTLNQSKSDEDDT